MEPLLVGKVLVHAGIIEECQIKSTVNNFYKAVALLVLVTRRPSNFGLRSIGS